MQEIRSNTSFMLNPDSVLPVNESAISLSTADNNVGYNPTNLNDTINVSFFLHDDFMCKGRSSPSYSMSTSSRTPTSTRSATSTRRVRK